MADNKIDKDNIDKTEEVVEETAEDVTEEVTDDVTNETENPGAEAVDKRG